jgi:hypothetical protein
MNIFFRILFILLFFQTSLFGQIYQIGHTTITLTDASRGNRSIATEIYYPADIAGDNVAITTQNTTQFPSLVFGHGFVMTWDAYQNYWSTLVPNGYIMAFPKTEGSISPSHIEFGKDLAFVINQLAALGTQSSSIFYNRVSAMNAVMGHSMGGGASFLAASLNSNIKTLVNFASAETTPSAISAATSITIPTIVFGGSIDCVAPPNTNQIPMYTALNSSCKTYISITDGTHCQMANANSLCNFGESTCASGSTLTRTAQHLKIISYLLPWLNYQLKADCAQGNIFDDQIITDSSITFQKNCIQCNPLENRSFNLNKNEIVLFPNPSTDLVKILGVDGKNYEIKIFDSNLKIVLISKFNSAVTVDTTKFSSGIYFYEVKDLSDKIEKGKFIKL